MMKKIDPVELRADADAHKARLEGPTWAHSGAGVDDDFIAQVMSDRPENKSTPQPEPKPRRAAQDGQAQKLLPGLEVPGWSEPTAAGAVQHRAMGSDVLPGWLPASAGDPHSYDTPDPSRRGVCARILPTTYHRFEMAQRRLKLRTKAATWEFLLRLGLAAAESLTSR